VSPEPEPVFLSVVIPVFNEEDNLATLFARTLPVLRALGKPFELVLVDDGSRDNTLEMLLDARAANPEVVVVSFVRNFGQHAAVIAGFAASRGEFVVTIDADLQNPPEEIPRLVAEYEKGHDLVGTVRVGRQDTLFRKKASKLVNYMTRRMSGIKLHDFGCMLRGYSRAIVKIIAARGEMGTFIPALGSLYARNPVEIEVRHESRHAGESKYSLVKLLRLHLDLVTGFSMAPLRILFTAGLVIAAVGIGFGLTLLVGRLFFGAAWAAQGVFTLFAILFVFVGAQFFAFGILGEYIGRIFMKVRDRPTYVLRDVDDETIVPARKPKAAARSDVEVRK
jgi:undecaprenyl-phosphate 4-deoxy-4-formamido-L-arabinose transferase